MRLDVVRLRENAILPDYQTLDAAGADLHACIDAPITLQPLERKLIPAGFSVAIPKGFEIQVRARSGMSIKHGITMVNGVGTIDTDYRGEMGALLINLSNEPFTIEPGMRVAQIVLARHEVMEWNEVAELDETNRGKGGFGSSGS